ncbi:SCO2400 family protein [Streptomyces sp. NPDC002514]|uniref:SCO2400 family protein n=1 Tax=Streptomyces sp. NPDC001270 TaxID=3364554 RepID=UPI0036B963EF
MDYCTSCRRHLNGALVCPGCGAYAPDIAPDVSASGITAATPERPDTALAVPAGRPPAAWLRRYDVPPADEPEYVPDTAAVPPPADDVASPAPSGEGRAARRRQRARWKKNQRRAVVATAVALVGGGLTVAAMDRHSARPQAATAPDNHRITLTGEMPEQTATVPAAPTDDATSASPSRTGNRDTGASRQRNEAAPRTVASITRPDSAVAPHPATTSTAHRPSTAAPATAHPSTGSQQPSGTPTPAPSTSTPAPSDPQTGTPAPSTPPSSDPTRLCLLVLCLG